MKVIIVVDWINSMQAGKWIDFDRFAVFFYYLFGGAGIFSICFTWYAINEGDTNYDRLLMLPLMLFSLIIVLIILHLPLKGMVLRRFNYKSDIVANTIESTLKKEGVSFNRLSERCTMPKFTLVPFTEIFKLDSHGNRIKIKVETPNSSGTRVLIGPLNEENRVYVDELTASLDEAFLPRGYDGP